MSSVENAEERKESLAVGDPEAGYGSRDPSGVFATGTVPEVEQKICEARGEAYEDEKEAVEEAEDAVVKRRRKEAEDAAKAKDDSSTSASAKSTSSKTSSASSSSAA